MSLARFGTAIVILLLAAGSASAQELCLANLFNCDHDAFYVQGNLVGANRSAQIEGESPFMELIFDDRGSDSTLGLGGAIGACDCYESDLLGQIRIRKELEGMWQGHSSHTIDGSDGFNPPNSFRAKIDQWTVVGNVWVDKPLTEDLLVYAGGGLGVAGTDLEFFGTRSSTQFAYQFGGGVTHQLSENCELDLGYRFLDAGEMVFNIPGGSARTDFHAHQMMLALRWYLP